MFSLSVSKLCFFLDASKYLVKLGSKIIIINNEKFYKI